MTLREFRNALRIMRSIDRHELVAAGVVGELLDCPPSDRKWRQFRDDPYHFFIRADDATAEKLWRLIERRQFAVPPVEALAGTKPLILFFGNEQDRAEFIALVHEAKPGMAEMVVP